MKTIIEKKSDQLVCDFCVNYKRKPVWWYAAKDDVMEYTPPAKPGTSNVVLQSHPNSPSTILVKTTGSLLLESTGGKWAACDRCKICIDAKKLHLLAYISTKQFIINHNVQIFNERDIEMIKQRIFNVQQAFWRNYDGQPAQRIEEKDFSGGSSD